MRKTLIDYLIVLILVRWLPCLKNKTKRHSEIILSIYIYFKDFKNLKLSLINFKFLFIVLLFLSFLIQQFIYSGCLFFPTNLTCLNVSWFNTEFLDLSKELELVNKSYFIEAKEIYSPEKYLSNFNWFYFWIKRNFIEILEHILTIILPSLVFLFFLSCSLCFVCACFALGLYSCVYGFYCFASFFFSLFSFVVVLVVRLLFSPVLS